MLRFWGVFLLSLHLVNNAVGDWKIVHRAVDTEEDEPRKRRLMRREAKRKHQSHPPSTAKVELQSQSQAKTKLGGAQAQGTVEEPEAKVKVSPAKRAKFDAAATEELNTRLDQDITTGKLQALKDRSAIAMLRQRARRQQKKLSQDEAKKVLKAMTEDAESSDGGSRRDGKMLTNAVKLRKTMRSKAFLNGATKNAPEKLDDATKSAPETLDSVLRSSQERVGDAAKIGEHFGSWANATTGTEISNTEDEGQYVDEYTQAQTGGTCYFLEAEVSGIYPNICAVCTSSGCQCPDPGDRCGPSNGATCDQSQCAAVCEITGDALGTHQCEGQGNGNANGFLLADCTQSSWEVHVPACAQYRGVWRLVYESSSATNSDPDDTMKILMNSVIVKTLYNTGCNNGCVIEIPWLNGQSEMSITAQSSNSDSSKHMSITKLVHTQKSNRVHNTFAHATCHEYTCQTSAGWYDRENKPDIACLDIACSAADAPNCCIKRTKEADGYWCKGSEKGNWMEDLTLEQCTQWAVRGGMRFFAYGRGTNVMSTGFGSGSSYYKYKCYWQDTQAHRDCSGDSCCSATGQSWEQAADFAFYKLA